MKGLQATGLTEQENPSGNIPTSISLHTQSSACPQHKAHTCPVASRVGRGALPARWPLGVGGGTGRSACPVASWGARSTLPARWSLEGRPDALRRAPPPLWSPAGSTLVLGLGAVAVCHPMGMLRDLLCSPWTPGEVSTALLSPLQDPPRRVSVLGSPLVSQVAQW